MLKSSWVKQEGNPACEVLGLKRPLRVCYSVARIRVPGAPAVRDCSLGFLSVVLIACALLGVRVLASTGEESCRLKLLLQYATALPVLA